MTQLEHMTVVMAIYSCQLTKNVAPQSICSIKTCWTC